MTTPIVPSITDEQLAELENAYEHFDGKQSMLIRGVLARLRSAEKDAARYRFVRCGGTKPGFLSSDPAKAKYLDEYLVCESAMDSLIDTAMEQSK